MDCVKCDVDCWLLKWKCNTTQSKLPTLTGQGNAGFFQRVCDRRHVMTAAFSRLLCAVS